MAETKGLVQRMTIVSSTVTCVWIGANPNNTSLLAVTNDGSGSDVAFASSLIQTLASAATDYRTVSAIHSSGDSKITAVRIDPV